MINKKNLFAGAWLGALIGLFAFAPIWVRNGGQYMDYGDYYLQYVPFIKELKRMAASGSLAWSWNSFLGDGFIGAYSYYTVFNPFAWLVALFPDDYILYGTMFATLLKCSVSMVSSMLFMRRFCRKHSYALIGAMLYTFSGFTLVNTNFYFFLDVIAVFPLLLYGLELLIYENKRAVYVLALMLNAAINYYFFVSTVFLVIIYVVFRLELYKLSGWKQHWKTFWRIVVFSVVGTGLAGFALVPSFYAILGSGKATETIGTSIELMYWPQKILEHIRTLVAPIESGRYNAFYDNSIWSSNGVYLPVFGCICVLQWCITKRDWLKKACILLTICYFFPFLNAVFNLFSSTAYTRWLYGMALLFSLVTALSLEEAEYAGAVISQRLLRVVTAFVAGLLLVPSVIYILHDFGISIVNLFASACTTEIFMGYDAIMIMLLLSAANYAVLWFVVRKKPSPRATVIIVAVACAVNFGVYNELNYDLHATDYSNQYYYEKSLIEGKENPEQHFEYRIDYPDQIVNYGLFKNRPAVNYYNSLQNPNGSRFAQAVGIGDSLKDTILIVPEDGAQYIDALLSVKYYYDYDGQGSIPEGFHYLRSESGVDIYENENYIAMGFVYEHYCLEEQLVDFLPEERAALMLRAMVIQKKDEQTVCEYLSPQTDITERVLIQDAVSGRNGAVCSAFVATSSGFNAEITLEHDEVVFFSIPNDRNWTVTVNGEAATVIDANYGLMGIICHAGTNQISATYFTQGWNLGLVVSITFAGAWMLLEMIEKKKCK